MVPNCAPVNGLEYRPWQARLLVVSGNDDAINHFQVWPIGCGKQSGVPEMLKMTLFSALLPCTDAFSHCTSEWGRLHMKTE